MGIKSQDLPGLQRAIDKALAKERGDVPEPPKKTWIARTGMLAIKPIKETDPAVFLAIVTKLQQMYPKLKIYIFEIDGG